MRGRLDWTALAAVGACLAALVLTLVDWHADAALPLTGLGVVLGLLALRG
jgi:hypothetical protein